MTDTTTTDITTQEALIKDLTRIYTSDNDNEHDLAKAKEKHEKGSEASLRAMAARLSAVNEDLSKEAIEAIAESVATRLAKGNKNILKSRKSEMKLCIEQRGSIMAAINEIDEVIQSRPADAKKIHLRSAVLGSLRVTKSDGVSASRAVESYLAKHDYEKTDVEKMSALIETLGKSDLLKVDIDDEKDIHPGVALALSAITQALSGDFSAINGLGLPTQPADDDSAPDVINELVPDLPSLDDEITGAERLSAQPTELTEIVEIPGAERVSPQANELTETDTDDLEASLAAITGGLL